MYWLNSVRCVMQVHAMQPHRTDCLLLLGAVHFHLRNFERSIQCNDVAILLDPSIVEAHANLGNALQQLGHLEMAAIYYQVRLPSSRWSFWRQHTTQSVLIFQPKYRLGQPETYLFPLYKKIFSGSKYPKNILFNFEKGSTGLNVPHELCNATRSCLKCSIHCNDAAILLDLSIVEACAYLANTLQQPGHPKRLLSITGLIR